MAPALTLVIAAMIFTTYGGAARWPFQLVLDAQYRQTGWVVLNGPIITRAQQEQFVELRRAGQRFVGASSYLAFPRGYGGGSLDYEMMCDAWCHCFPDPDRFLPATLPRALISVSDFTDYRQISPERVAPSASSKRFDVIYVGATDAWKRDAKNWPLAARIVPRLCRELDLRALVIGSPAGEFQPSAGVSFSPLLPWPVLLAHLARARFLFVPNVTHRRASLLKPCA